MWENTAPGTEFPRILCAGIGTLHLGVMLVLLLIKCVDHTTFTHCNLNTMIQRPRQMLVARAVAMGEGT